MKPAGSYVVDGSRGVRGLGEVENTHRPCFCEKRQVFERKSSPKKGLVERDPAKPPGRGLSVKSQRFVTNTVIPEAYSQRKADKKLPGGHVPASESSQEAES